NMFILKKRVYGGTKRARPALGSKLRRIRVKCSALAGCLCSCFGHCIKLLVGITCSISFKGSLHTTFGVKDHDLTGKLTLILIKVRKRVRLINTTSPRIAPLVPDVHAFGMA